MELSSEEGTTQGCPLSMAMYALSTVPLIDKCRSVLSTDDSPSAVQIWYTDDWGEPEDFTTATWTRVWVLHKTIKKTFLVLKPECRS